MPLAQISRNVTASLRKKDDPCHYQLTSATRSRCNRELADSRVSTDARLLASAAGEFLDKSFCTI